LGLIPQLSRQGAPGFASLAGLESSLAGFGRVRTPQQFHKVLCRLDRERLDCIVLKTHLE
jgi:hypothetical protein